jgi:hypothetical protein
VRFWVSRIAAGKEIMRFVGHRSRRGRIDIVLNSSRIMRLSLLWYLKTFLPIQALSDIVHILQLKTPV